MVNIIYEEDEDEEQRRKHPDHPTLARGADGRCGLASR
jgi:hypothetical protein